MFRHNIALFLCLFLLFMYAKACSSTYWVDYVDNKLPKEAYEVYKKNGSAVYVAQILKFGVYVGELLEKEHTIFTYANKNVTTNRGIKVLCAEDKDKLFWKTTTRATFDTTIVGTKPVVGGVFNGQPIYIGKDDEEKLVGNIIKGVLFTTKKEKFEYSILVEKC